MRAGPLCAWAILAVGLTSCTYWAPYPRPTPGVAPVRLPTLLRTTTATAPALISSPFVRNDTLFGQQAGDTIGIALQELRSLERPRVYVIRTIGLVVGATAGLFTLGLYTGGLE
jgi:hypothetical protein